ncbi:MAG: phosphoribosylanthranilate isomerase [Candidatus Tokpelaia sp. JSC188]|nr:MAG: phosphoribosylanthranilate isomerase [Candidatus Tokpelaia sp. JSC188]
MTLDIKICGLKTHEALDAALANKATHIGFVFFEKSPRHISLPQAVSLRDSVRGQAQVVTVTVDADNMLLDEIVYHVKPNLLQLHGLETPRRVVEIKNRYKLPIMKAFAISNKSNLQNIVPYHGIIDRILFDAKASKGAFQPGGNGVAFNWQVLDTLDREINYFLSGGLNANNIAEALRTTRAHGVDVSSGVETEPGVKDVDLINAFFSAVQKIRKKEDEV